MTNTKYTKSELTQILSALKGAPAKPANVMVAYAAIRREASKINLTSEAVFAEADSLLSGDRDPIQWRSILVADTIAGAEIKREAAKAAVVKTGTRDEETPTAPKTRANSKQAQTIEMLRRKDGASIDEIATAMGWQKHTVRGMISGALKKKLGLTIASGKIEGRGMVYFLED